MSQNVTLFLYEKSSGQKNRIGVGSYDNQGNYKIVTRAMTNSSFSSFLEVMDPSGQYMSNVIDIKLKAKENQDFYLGDILLLTQSGEGCKDSTNTPATNTCLSNQPVKSYDLTVNLSPIEGSKNQTFDIKIYKGFSVSGPVVVSK